MAELLIGATFLMSFQAGAEDDKGIIGKLYEDGVPVLYSFVNEMPADEVREQLPLLTVISWKYDGGESNGMPAAEENQKMMQLEDAIQEHIDGESVLRHAYSRTGNHLKELVYYIHDQQQFLEAFNDALSGHPPYPIEIKFYRDPQWKHFEELMDDFSGAAGK